MRELLTFVAQSLVDHPDQVVVRETEGPEAVILELSVAEEDMGKVIGKQGRIAKAIRTVVSAATAKNSINTRELYAIAHNSIARKGQGATPLAESRGSASGGKVIIDERIPDDWGSPEAAGRSRRSQNQALRRRFGGVP